jgi:hypothetical protein
MWRVMDKITCCRVASDSVICRRRMQYFMAGGTSDLSFDEWLNQWLEQGILLLTDASLLPIRPFSHISNHVCLYSSVVHSRWITRHAYVRVHPIANTHVHMHKATRTQRLPASSSSSSSSYSDVCLRRFCICSEWFD